MSGFAGDDAVALAARTDVDLHEAIELVQRGCPPELAVRILVRPDGRRAARAQCVLVTGLVLGYIPSPSNGTFSLGPLTLHMYGVMLLLGIAACIWLTGRALGGWGGDWDLVFRVALWGVIAGVIGARLYHDITSWNQDPAIHAHWWGFAAVWNGGLGVWGGIPLGVLAGAFVVHRSGNSVTLMMDAVAPGLLLAQGIGRWGNYWNQELYGRPTTLPWGLKIDPGAPERDPGALSGPRRLPAHVPLRVHLGPARSRRPALGRPALHDQAAGALRALRRVVHDLPHVRGGPADRPVQLLPPHADQLLGLARALGPSRSGSSSGGSSCASPRARSPRRSRGAVPSGPRMAVPKGRVR